MPPVIDRRGFLIRGTQATVGMSLLGGHSVRAQERSARTRFLESRIAEWDQGIPRWLRDARLPGASMAIIDAGKVLWEGQFGVKDAGTGDPVRRDTVFAACSNTKPVFAYAVVKLCEKGVMDLDSAADEVHVAAIRRGRSAARPDYRPTCPDSYDRLSQLARAGQAPADPVHARHPAAVFRRRLPLSAVRCSGGDRPAVCRVHARQRARTIRDDVESDSCGMTRRTGGGWRGARQGRDTGYRAVADADRRTEGRGTCHVRRRGRAAHDPWRLREVPG